MRGQQKWDCTHVLFLLLLMSVLVMAGCTTADKPEQKTIAAGIITAELTTASAETMKPMESGAGYFQRYYTQKAVSDTDHDYSHMGLVELEAMVSSTVGTVVDTEELSIEVLGALFSGNTAEIVLRVTAKELESVLNDDEEAYSSHYRFADDSAMLGIFTLERHYDELSTKYTYCDTDESLAPNQFLLHYWITSPELLKMDVFSIPLQGLGRISRQGRIVSLYEETWLVDIDVDPASDNSKRLTPSDEITAGEYRFKVDEIQITSLACTVCLRCLGEDTYLEENEDRIFQVILDGREKIELNLVDGTSLVPDPYQVNVGSGENMQQPDGVYNEYRIGFRFDAPVAVEDIISLGLFGNVLVCK